MADPIVLSLTFIGIDVKLVTVQSLKIIKERSFSEIMLFN